MSETHPAPSAGQASSAQLVAELYCELRQLAAAKLQKLPPGQTLQATALVHEVYLRLSASPSQWQNRAHFFASAAEAMRRVLVDQARRKHALRRGGGASKENIDSIQIDSPEPDDRILAVHEALDALELDDPLQAEIVKLRFFAGLNHHEAAAALGISEKTVRRHWNIAKIRLYQLIAQTYSAPSD